MKNIILSLALVTGLTSFAGNATGQTTTIFGTGANQFSLGFTTIGNVGNAADTTGYGSVGYTYRIGTYDISQSQIDKATASGLAHVTAGAWSGDQPAANISWFESAAFVNWLNTSKGFQAAYNLTWSGNTWSMALWTAADAGYDPSNPFRNSLALYVLPSQNEFYKAAFGKSDGSGYYLYSTASNVKPTLGSDIAWGTQPPSSVYAQGKSSSYGTVGQFGDVWQWEESNYSGNNNNPTGNRAGRGILWQSQWKYDSSTLVEADPTFEANWYGFRVAEITANNIPEPSTYALFGIGAIGLLIVIGRRKGV